MAVTDLLPLIKGKVAVITGGSGGIGKAVAEAVINNGGYAVIGDILEQQGQAVVEEFNKRYSVKINELAILIGKYLELAKKVAAFIRTDVTTYKDNQALFNLAETEFGGVDFVLLNAGVALGGNSNFTPLDDKADEKIMDVNAMAVIKGTKVALLHLAKRGGGSIVHLASCAGFFSSPEMPSYNASKHAVIGYTRSFTLMPQICNVRVNAVCPYWVDTDMIKNLHTDGDMKRLEVYIAQCPHTTLDIVVGGILNFFVDQTKNTEAALALPDGLKYMARPDWPESFHNNESRKAAKAYYGTYVHSSKKRLAEALKSYGFKSSL